MGINIWLPIIVNAIILGIMVAGAFIGKKNGFLYELFKFITLCGFGVGVYFLNPIAVNGITQIPFIQMCLTEGYATMPILNALSLLAMFLVSYLVITITFKLIKRLIVKRANKLAGVNIAKPAKIYGLTKKETRRLRKENKKLIKANKKEEKKALRAKQSVASKVFGLIFGLLSAIVIAFAITLPLKPISKHIVEIQPELSEIEKGYEYTPYGQLDKVTGIVEKILK